MFRGAPQSGEGEGKQQASIRAALGQRQGGFAVKGVEGAQNTQHKGPVRKDLLKYREDSRAVSQFTVPPVMERRVG